MNKKLLTSEALAIASAPLVGYLIMTFYFSEVEGYFGIPGSFWSGNLYLSIGIGVALGFILLFAYWVSEIISRIIPLKNNNPLLVRIRRILQVTLFFTIGLYFQVFTGNDSTGSERLFEGIILWLCVAFIFACREIVLPLFRQRKVTGMLKRLKKDRPSSDYTNTKDYYKSFLSATSIGLLFIPIVLMVSLVSKAGEDAVDISHKRSYMIIDSNPKRIVLINYGDRWLTAVYDDKYPNKPAYRKDYQIINSDEFGKTKFSIKTLDLLYVYN